MLVLLAKALTPCPERAPGERGTILGSPWPPHAGWGLGEGAAAHGQLARRQQQDRGWAWPLLLSRDEAAVRRQGALPGPSTAPSSPVLGPACSIARGGTISLASGTAGKRQRQGTTQTPSKTPAKRDGQCPGGAVVPTQKYIIMSGGCGAPWDQREGRGLLRALLLGGLSPLGCSLSSSSLQGWHRGPAPLRALRSHPLPSTVWSLSTGC